MTFISHGSFEQDGVVVTDEDCWEARMAGAAFVRRLTAPPPPPTYDLRQVPVWRLRISDSIYWFRRFTDFRRKR